MNRILRFTFNPSCPRFYGPIGSILTNTLRKPLSQIHTPTFQIMTFTSERNMILYKPRMQEHISINLYYIFTNSPGHTFIPHHGKPKSFILMPKMYDRDRAMRFKHINQDFGILGRTIISDNNLIRFISLMKNTVQTHTQCLWTIVGGNNQRDSHSFKA